MIRRLFRLRILRDDILERDVDEEIRAHIEERSRRLEDGGLSAEDARAEALRRFGPIEEARATLLAAARERERALGWSQWLDGVRQDLAHAVRSVRREPGVAAVVILVIALGVGANAAMFGVLDRLLLRGPEHVVHPERLRRLQVQYTAEATGLVAFTASTFNHAAYAALRDGAEALDGVAAWSRTEGTLGEGEGVERVHVGHATWDFFPVLGARAAHGRFFGEHEDLPGASGQVMVLGHALWRRRFGGDTAVIGSSVSLGGVPHRVIGVAPLGFTGATLSPVDVWVPMALRSARISEGWRTTWSAQWLDIVVRLGPGVTLEQAGADATRVLRSAYPESWSPERASFIVSPLWYDDEGREAMEVAVARWLMAVSLIVLLVACANVANLLLGRAIRRRREVAVRVALGIARGRLIRLLLSESVLLALIGGLGALAVAAGATGLVRSTLLPDVEWVGATFDGRVLLLAAVLTLLAGLATGLMPAIQAGRHDVLSSLKTGVREGGGRGSKLRPALAIAQAAFSMVLLIGAGLFLRSLWQAESADLGVEPDRVVAVSAMWMPPPADSPDARPRRGAFYAEALERAGALRRIESAALAIGTPFHSSFSVDVRAEGWDSIPELPGGGPYVHAVSPGYFETVGLERLSGRLFEEGEGAGTEPVAIVSERMARRLWPETGALGRCLWVEVSSDVPCSRVVGVVEDALRFRLAEDPAMQYYVPLGQERGMGGTMLLLRPSGDPSSMIEPLRRELSVLDAQILWLEVEALQEELDPQLRPWRMGATLIGVFAGLALIISAVGLYSLIAYMVASRTHEMGLRLALGAEQRDVFALVLRRGLGLALAGLAIGIGLGVAGAPLVGDLLFRTSPRDPVVFGAVAVTLFVAATAACLVPARRATRVEPMRALRVE